MKPSEAAIDRTALNLSLENITTLIPSPLEALKKQNSNENGMERSMGKNGDDSDSTGENSIEDLHNSEWDGLDFLDLKSTREETTQVGNYVSSFLFPHIKEINIYFIVFIKVNRYLVGY